VGKAELDAEETSSSTRASPPRTQATYERARAFGRGFIENAVVDSGENVIVSDGIINSTVDANKKIVCQGKRAAIVGGHLRQLRRSTPRSSARPSPGRKPSWRWASTRRARRSRRLDRPADQLRRQIDELEKNILTLDALKKQKKALPDDKEALLQEQTGRRQTSSANIRRSTRRSRASPIT
jgi:uncharacterized protein (DUF342 family)